MRKKIGKKIPIIRIQRRRWNKRYYNILYRHNYREWLRKLSIRKKILLSVGFYKICGGGGAGVHSSRTD